MSPPLLIEAFDQDAKSPKSPRRRITDRFFRQNVSEISSNSTIGTSMPKMVLVKRMNSSDSLTASTSSSSDLEEGPVQVVLAASSVENSSGNALCNNLKKASTREQALKLCFGASGIYACYLFYGSLQEDVFRYRAADGSRFQQVWFLQVLECACNIVVGIIGRRIFGGRTPISLTPFFQSGASQVFSKVLTSLSLAAGLSFPVCILSKSAKMVPVMLGQLVLGGSSYTWRDYMFAGSVVVGTAMLSMGKASSKDTAADHSTPTGLAFIILSLVMDGITGGLQKRLKKETADHPPTTYDFLLYTNLSMFLVAFTISVAIGDFGQGLWFLAQNPLMQQMILLTCLLSAMGQSFIFYVVANFDPMVCATVTTTRKIFSVLWSIAVKGHVVSHGGHAGLVIAIGGILLGFHEKLTSKKRRRQTQREHEHSKKEMGLC